MKRIYKILILITILFVCIIGVVAFNNKENVKSIRSERQLLRLYKNQAYSSDHFFEKILAFPISLQTRGYRYTKGYVDIVDVESVKVNNIATPSNSFSKDYSKTNIQVEGVDEADIIKTDGDYIYSISENNVIITNVKDPNNIVIDSKIYTDSSIPNDLLLHKNYLIVFSSSNNSRYVQNTLVDVYDITDKKSPKRVKSFELYEQYYTSRCIDGNLYVFSKGSLRQEKNKIVREYKEENKTKEIELKNIKYLKDNPTNIQTLIAHLDLNNISSVDVKSYLIDISNAYVSKDNIYLLDNVYDDDYIKISSIFTLKGVIGFLKSVGDYSYEPRTKIYKFKINKDNGVVFDTTKVVDGKINNQYSLDEKDKHLRIALETNEGTRIAILNEKLNLIGETEKVAKGEKMYASRFIGDKAYLVTYRNTDPLFVVDLSDESNPEVMGELKIPGYSTYLHPYDENHLIGIGMDTEEVVNRDSSGKVISTWVRTNGMKMCLFDVSDITNPKELSKITIGDSRTVSAILSNPKALLFSKEKSLLAIPVNNYNEDFSVTYSDDYSTQISNFTGFKKDYISEGYFVYSVDLTNGFDLKGIINHKKETNKYYYYYNNSRLLRGVYIDNNLYTVSEDYVKVNSLKDLTEISSLKIKE